MGLSLQGESHSGMGVYSVDKLIAEARRVWTREKGIEHNDVWDYQASV